MTWVRYDDNVRNHPKVEPLDDATYRLWREALEWSAQNLTDGVIRTRQLGITSTRATAVRARKLVDAVLWHKAGSVCESEYCPPSGVDGWFIHDFWDYQPTAEQVREEQEKARERKRKWMERRKNAVRNGVGNAAGNAVPNGVGNGNPAPPRPAPKGRGGLRPPAPPAAAGDGTPAGGEADDPKPTPPAANGQATTEAKAAIRAAIASRRRRARDLSNFDELRAATPDVPELVEPTPEAS